MFSVIFEVHPGEDKRNEYLGHAKELKPILEGIDGFIDNERFDSRSRPGWVLSHSTWRDEKSVIRWRTQARHHLIQGTGRFEIFSDYHLRVGEVTEDTHPPDGMTLREQRFDTTEVGRAKCCTILELRPREGAHLPKDEDAVLRAIKLDRGAPGLDEAQVYDSIYNVGKVLVLGSWLDPDASAGWRPGEVAGAETLRRRRPDHPRLRHVRPARDAAILSAGEASWITAGAARAVSERCDSAGVGGEARV